MTDQSAEGLPTLTLDTSVILEYLREQRRADVVQALLTLAADHHVDLAVTARIHEDVPLPPLADRLNELPELGVSEAPSIARIGFWELGRDMLGSDRFQDVSAELDAILLKKGHSQPDWRDWDHIHAHYLLHRDFFLTWDKPLLSLAPELESQLGLVVTTPEAYIARGSRPA